MDDSEAERAIRLGIDRCELIREALRHRLDEPGREADAAIWAAVPATEGEKAFAKIAAWGSAGDWSDWVEAAR